MKTLEQMIAEKTLQPNGRRLSFKEFCQHVYEPAKRINSLNFSRGLMKRMGDSRD